MKIFKRKPKLREVTKSEMMDAEIQKILEEMQEIEDPSSAEYKEYQERLNQAIAIKDKYEANTRSKRKVNPDEILKCGVNILELVMIMNFERLHVIATKAFGRIVRPKF